MPANSDQTPIESVLDPFQAQAISQLSAYLTRERSGWNQPNHTWHLHPIAWIETNPKGQCHWSVLPWKFGE